MDNGRNQLSLVDFDNTLKRQKISTRFFFAYDSQRLSHIILKFVLNLSTPLFANFAPK